jgi:hypothetical protein
MQQSVAAGAELPEFLANTHGQIPSAQDLIEIEDEPRVIEASCPFFRQAASYPSNNCDQTSHL